MKRILSTILCLIVATICFAQLSLYEQKLPKIEEDRSIVIKTNSEDFTQRELLNFKTETSRKDLDKWTIITGWAIINSAMTYAFIKQDDKSTASTLGYTTLTVASTALCVTLLIIF